MAMHADLTALLLDCRRVISDDIDMLWECHCVLDAAGKPIKETVEEDVAVDIEQLESLIRRIDAARSEQPPVAVRSNRAAVRCWFGLHAWLRYVVMFSCDKPRINPMFGDECRDCGLRRIYWRVIDRMHAPSRDNDAILMRARAWQGDQVLRPTWWAK